MKCFVISTQLNLNGDVIEILDEFFIFGNKHRKKYENDFHSNFEDYRDSSRLKSKTCQQHVQEINKR